MIAVHGQYGEFREAIFLFIKMQYEGVEPNEVTLVSLVASCTNLSEGRWLHSLAFEKQLDSNDPIKNALLNMYVQFGSIEDAQILFYSLSERDPISWSGMITALAEHGRKSEALQYYVQMQKEGKRPNEVSFVNILCACATQVAVIEGRLLHACILENGIEVSIDVSNALINLYGKCGSLMDAWGVFSAMGWQRDIVSWNTILTVFSQHGHGEAAVEMLDQMSFSESIPDKLTIASVLSACSHAGLVEMALQLFISAEENCTNLISQDHYVCLIDLLGRVGCLVEALHLIASMPIQPTVLSFMAFLGSCQFHAQVELAEDASQCLIELDEENSAPYVVLSNIYAATGWKVGL
jgi:pentatricopeptide repeat protein